MLQTHLFFDVKLFDCSTKVLCNHVLFYSDFGLDLYKSGLHSKNPETGLVFELKTVNVLNAQTY